MPQNGSPCGRTQQSRYNVVDYQEVKNFTLVTRHLASHVSGISDIPLSTLPKFPTTKNFAAPIIFCHLPKNWPLLILNGFATHKPALNQ